VESNQYTVPSVVVNDTSLSLTRMAWSPRLLICPVKAIVVRSGETVTASKVMFAPSAAALFWKGMAV
jgi:hypothetical protein